MTTELDVFLQELHDTPGPLSAKRLEAHAQGLVLAYADEPSSAGLDRINTQLQHINILALCSIAKSLEMMLKNGLTVETTR